MKRYLLALAIVGVILVSGYAVLVGPKKEACRDFSEGIVTVEGQVIAVAITDNDDERTLGLGGCQELPNKTGMYFPFSPPRTASIWMKGMVMPIDIVWIADGKVVGVEANVQPQPGAANAELRIFQSPQAVIGVLEIGAGKAEAYGLAVGQTVVTPHSTEGN